MDSADRRPFAHIARTARAWTWAFALAVPWAPQAAQAAWLGLVDGQYAVTLNCDFSGVIPCPSSIQGTLTIAGNGVTQMDFGINGEVFAGNPLDGFFDGSLADFENSTLAFDPNFRFLSLRLITAGQIGVYGVGDRWWVYCNNFDIDSCTPNTTGTWSARLIGAVPAPSPLILALGGLAALAGLRINRRRARCVRTSGLHFTAPCPSPLPSVTLPPVWSFGLPAGRSCAVTASP